MNSLNKKLLNLSGWVKKQYYFPKYSKWVFLSFLIFFSFLFNYQEILFKSPQGLHQWRQCDCLSIAFNYYSNNNHFFEPSVHNLGTDGTGKTVSDFPLIYYLVGQLSKLIGFHECVYRFIVLCFFFTGLFTLFKITERLLKDSVLAICCSLLLFTSPTLIYYANNFLMDIPAFSMAIIGFYFFYRFIHSQSNKHLIFSVFFYSIAGLLKISSLLSFGVLFVLFFLELFQVNLRVKKKIFFDKKLHFFLLLSVLFIQIIWYTYASFYNTKYNSGFFLIGILPIWDLEVNQIKIVLNAIIDHVNWDYFRKETQIVFILMFLFSLFFYKKANKILLYSSIFIVLGFLIYLLLFFQALQDHDYYTINLFIVVPFVLLVFLLVIKFNFNFIFRSPAFRLLLIVFLIHNLDFARRRMSGRYELMSWQNSYYTQNLKSFEEISLYLKSIGIHQYDKVIVLPDMSINISLYLMNQKGWTNFDIMKNEIRLKEKIKLGAKYILIHENEISLEKFIIPHVKCKIGKYKNISIYKI